MGIKPPHATSPLQMAGVPVIKDLKALGFLAVTKKTMVAVVPGLVTMIILVAAVLGLGTKIKIAEVEVRGLETKIVIGIITVGATVITGVILAETVITGVISAETVITVVAEVSAVTEGVLAVEAVDSEMIEVEETDAVSEAEEEAVAVVVTGIETAQIEMS